MRPSCQSTGYSRPAHVLAGNADTAAPAVITRGWGTGFHRSGSNCRVSQLDDAHRHVGRLATFLRCLKHRICSRQLASC